MLYICLKLPCRTSKSATREINIVTFHQLPDQFNFDNPLFPGHHYKLAQHVTELIQGPGDITMDGIWVHFGFMTPKIERVVRLTPTKSRVETSYGSLDKPVFVIRVR